jgi:uncharacterized protein YqhQ
MSFRIQFLIPLMVLGIWWFVRYAQTTKGFWKFPLGVIILVFGVWASFWSVQIISAFSGGDGFLSLSETLYESSTPNTSSLTESEESILSDFSKIIGPILVLLLNFAIIFAVPLVCTALVAKCWNMRFKSLFYTLLALFVVYALVCSTIFEIFVQKGSSS